MKQKSPTTNSQLLVRATETPDGCSEVPVHVASHSFRPSCTVPTMRPRRIRAATESRSNEFDVCGSPPADTGRTVASTTTTTMEPNTMAAVVPAALRVRVS